MDTERSYDTFGNVVLDLTLERVDREVEFTSWIVVEREAGADGAHYSEPLSPDTRFSEPSRLTRPDDALTAAAAELQATGVTGLELAELISTRVHEHLRYDWERRRSRPRPPRRGPEAPASARTTRTACSRSRGSAASPPATSPGTCSARAARTPGSRSSSRTRSSPNASRLFPSIRRTSGVPGCGTSRSPWAATTRDVAPTSGTYDGAYEGLLTTSKRAAVTSVEYLRPRRRRTRRGSRRLAPEQRLEPRQVPLAERGQAAVLDLVDEHGHAALDQPVVERTGAVALELVLVQGGPPSGRASR